MCMHVHTGVHGYVCHVHGSLCVCVCARVYRACTSVYLCVCVCTHASVQKLKEQAVEELWGAVPGHGGGCLELVL